MNELGKVILGNIDLTEAAPALQQILLALDQTTIIAITDERGVILHVNDRFCEISKYSREELVGQNHRLVKSGHHPPEFFHKMWRTIASGQVWHEEIKNRAKDGGYYWVETSIIPFFNETGRPYRYVAIRKDITERKILSEQIELEKAKTVVAEKMASLGEMAAGIAHELGNPLGAIRGRMEMLMNRASRGPVAQEELVQTSEKVIAMVDRTSKIIRGLKSYARDASKDPMVSANLNQLLTDTLEFSQVRLKKIGIELSVDVPDEDIFASCREAEISQVVVNIVNNACDVLQNSPEKKIWVSLATTERHVEIRVKDSGPGIPESIRNRIFDPFFTTKGVGVGTGLGLSIAMNIMRAHGGVLELLSDEKTCFLLRWPKGSAEGGNQ